MWSETPKTGFSHDSCIHIHSTTLYKFLHNSLSFVNLAYLIRISVKAIVGMKFVLTQWGIQWLEHGVSIMISTWFYMLKCHVQLLSFSTLVSLIGINSVSKKNV